MMIHTLASAQQALGTGQISAEALTETALQRITDPEGQGRKAFTEVLSERARVAARASDAVRRAGLMRSPLEGVPVSVKDLFDVAGTRTLAGSKALAGTLPATRDAGAVRRLALAGAIVVGKTNMTEFAYSGLGINPHYGTPANPWRRDLGLIPGGSSSGAAVAISDGMCTASIGSDTGGSARIPAAFCGITGFKPTAARMPSDGMVPLSTTLDAVGVLAQDVATCSAVDAVLAGVTRKRQDRSLKQARFAVPTTLVQDGLDDAVAMAWADALRRLSAAGAELVELPLAEFNELADINAQGGFSAAESWAWHADLFDQQREAYDPRVLSRILRGRDFTAKAYIELHARRADWQQRVAVRLAGFDGWLMPTVPMVAPRISDLEADEKAYFSANAGALRNPSIVNFQGGCALSLPCHQAGQAPVGLSLAGPAMADEVLLDWGLAIESVLRPQI